METTTAQDITTALNLLGIGMITVFVVLTLVVIIGNLLIRFVNGLPESMPASKESTKGQGEINPKTVAVLSAVVDNITKGKGSIKHIEKIQ